MRSLILGSLLLLAACTSGVGGDDPVDSDDIPVSPGDPLAVLVIADQPPHAGDAAIGVSQALEHRATDDLVVVTGALFVDAAGTVRLCEAIAESFPPQCGGARLEVRGLDLVTIPGLQRDGDVRWSESAVLFGSVE